MSRKMLSVCLLVAVIVSLATLACGISPERQLQPTPMPPATPLPPDAPVPPPTAVPRAVQRSVPGPVESSYMGVNSLDGPSDPLGKLVANSSVIIIGTVPTSDPKSLRVQDQTNANVRALGNGFNVQVERYLKGSGAGTIPVIQFYGLEFMERGRIQQARDKDESLSLGKGDRYLLFLGENGSYPGYWSGPAHPYKFLLSGGRAKAESPVGDLGGTFPEQSEAEFISSVEAKIEGTRSTVAKEDPRATLEATPEVSPALLKDARSYAEDFGVELDEAVAILIGQDTIGELDHQLQSNESETFGGLWIQNEPDYRVIVTFTQDGEKTIRPYLDGTMLIDIVEVRQVETSLMAVRRARDEAVAMVKGLGFDAGSGIDIPNNVAQIYLSAKKKEELEKALQEAGLVLPDRVELVAQRPPSPA